ncbi:MAG: LacI family DNA-binding transcriptional regulator [Bacteroidales bacterium]
MKKRITIKDIALALNIHHSTVSRALHDDSRVNSETKKLINDYATSHGYKVNQNAVNLRNGKHNVIALLVPNVHHTFFSNIISYITDMAKKAGYMLVIFQSNEKEDEEKEIIDTIIQNQFTGVIASISSETTDSSNFKKLLEYNVSLVFFDRILEEMNVSKVIEDGENCTYEVAQQLYKRKYKRIAHISGPSHINVFRNRQRGYKRAVKSNNSSYEKIVIIENDFSMEEGRRIAKNLLKNDRPDAIICDSFNISIGILSVINEMGIKSPEEMGFICYGNDPAVNLFTPTLSTIEQADKEIAIQAFNLLLKNIENKNTPKKTIKIPLKICLRESC